MTPEPTPSFQEGELPPGAERLVRLAVEDLARRLDTSPEGIVVVSVEAAQWSDTSLGCPQPGMMYAQVITPGFRVVLEVEGQAYEYHTDADSVVVLCNQDGQPAYPTIPVKPGDITDGDPWMPIGTGVVLDPPPD